MPIHAALGGLIAKFGALGAASKVAAVTAVAAAGVGATGAAGALPQPVQQPFDRAVHAFVETQEAEPTADAGDASDQGTDPTPTPTPTPSPEPSATPAHDNFGARVSEDARDGGVDGRQISQEAKNNGRGTDKPAKNNGNGNGSGHRDGGQASETPTTPAEDGDPVTPTPSP